MAVTLCVLLFAAPGNESVLAEYEDRVLALLPRHGGRVIQRVRNREHATGPHEVHVLEFPSDAALERYMADPDRLALGEMREQAIAKTDVLRVDPVL